jgi:hypothetical protein
MEPEPEPQQDQEGPDGPMKRRETSCSASTVAPHAGSSAKAQLVTMELSRVDDAPLLLRASWRAHGTVLFGAEIRRLDGGALPEGMPLGQYHALSPTGFRDACTTTAGGSDAHAAADEQLWIVFFHIMPDCVDGFKALLLAECEATLVPAPEYVSEILFCLRVSLFLIYECYVVQVAEPCMLRYDLLQCESDPTRFVVLEFLRDAEAMAMHEARRADGTMRAALAKMEATGRKDIPGSALQWGAADRLALQSRLAWPSVWRSSAVHRLSNRSEECLVEASTTTAGADEYTLLLRAALQSTMRYRKNVQAAEENRL